jgi:glyoxylate carboligase
VVCDAQVVYLGGGCLDASPEVREFIKHTNIPVASTLMGLGTYPATDPLALQMLGMHGTVFANYSVDQVRAGAFWEGAGLTAGVYTVGRLVASVTGHVPVCCLG